MKFTLDSAQTLQVTDRELSGLLMQVYVEGGYTEQERAQVLFEPSAVRQRGLLIGAREKSSFDLAGMVIVVPPDSPGRRLALAAEAEMHLLSVKPEYRKHGLGRLLVEFAVETAKQNGCEKMILWTQTAMKPAQHLYESTGFVRAKERDFSRHGRDFWVYERCLRS